MPNVYVCPHCKRDFAANRINVHIPVCPDDPIMRARVIAVLQEHATAGCAPEQSRYGNIVSGSGLPSWQAIARYPGWPEMYRRAGLRPPSERQAARLEFTRAELRRLSQELHDGKFGPSLTEYDIYAHKDAYHNNVLTRRHGGKWPAVLAWAGLRYAERVYYYHRALERAAELDEPPDVMSQPEYKLALPGGMPAKPCVRPVLVWDVATHAYRAVDGVARLSLLLV